MSQKSIIVTLVVSSLLLVALCMQGCGGYPEVSQETYRHAQALYSACNRKDAERLARCADMVDASEKRQDISSSEASYLNAIIDAADAKEWTEAQQMARQLMVDQAGR